MNSVKRYSTFILVILKMKMKKTKIIILYLILKISMDRHLYKPKTTKKCCLKFFKRYHWCIQNLLGTENGPLLIGRHTDVTKSWLKL